SGVLTLSGGYTPATVGGVLIGAWAANDPPPSLGGTGRPVSARFFPKAAVVAALGTGLPFKLPGLGTSGSYRVGAMMDRGGSFSPVLSYMSSPGLGAQGTFAAAPVAAGTTQNLQLDAGG